jgi:hypothetical protein
MERRRHGLYLPESGRICQVSLGVVAGEHMPEAPGVFRIAQDDSTSVLQAQQLAQLRQTAEHVWVRIDHQLY